MAKERSSFRPLEPWNLGVFLPIPAFGGISGLRPPPHAASATSLPGRARATPQLPTSKTLSDDTQVHVCHSGGLPPKNGEVHELRKRVSGKPHSQLPACALDELPPMAVEEKTWTMTRARDARAPGAERNSGLQPQSDVG